MNRLPMLLLAIVSFGGANLCFSAEVLVLKKFTDLCDEGNSVFDQKDDLPLHIRLYILSARARTAAPYIAVTLKRGTDADAEIPRFDKICVSDPSLSATLKKNGDIYFKTPLNQNVNMVFRRHDADLKHTKWKVGANNTGGPSIWMVEYPASASSHKPPTVDDWCTNIPKKVDLGGTNNSDISFEMCPYVPNLQYDYALHLDQAGNSGSDVISVDIGVDPQIIHQP
jgi:hypothetical protein